MRRYLAKGISNAKWQSRRHIPNHSLPADAIGADLRTQENTLSFWSFCIGSGEHLEDVVLALAATRDNVQRLDLAWVDEKKIKRMKLRVEATDGTTPATDLKDRHRDVVGIDLDRMCRLARGIRDSLDNDRTRIFREKEVLEILAKGAEDKVVPLNELKPNVIKWVEDHLAATKTARVS